MCAGATTGRLGSQSVGSFVSTFFPECNGQESSISDCTKTRECSSTNSEMGKLVVTCVMDSDLGVADSGTLCNMSSTSAPPATTESELPVTTSVASPPPNATDDMYTNTDSSSSGTKVGASGSNEQVPIGTIAIVVGGVAGGAIVVLVTIVIIAAVICRRSSHRKQNNDQVSPDSPVKVHNTDRYKDLEPGTYSELNNNTVTQHQVPVYDTVKNKSQNLSEVSASDNNEEVGNHTYSALDPEAIYSQIPPHLGLAPGDSKTLPVGLKDVSPSTLYQTLDRSLSLPRTSGSSNSASGHMLTHAVNRTALALESGNISETDLASPRSNDSVKYPSPHGSPKQHHSSSSQSSTGKEELPLIRNPTNAQMENYYHVLDPQVPTVAAASTINTTASSDIDSQVSTDAVCNQQIMDDCRQPHCHSPRRQRLRVGIADEMMVAEGGDQQHFYATLEPSVRAQLTPPSRHDTRQRSQSTLNNRSPPQQQRMRSNSSKGDMRVNYSGQRVVNNISQSSLQPEVTNTLV